MNKLMLVVVFAGCTRVDSSDILTSGIYADLTASTSGDGSTDVSATLYLGNPVNLNFVELTGNDELVASQTGGPSKVMTETSILNIVSHHASFPTDAEGEEFNIDLQRSVDNGAPSSLAVLPAKFTLTGPTAATSRTAAIALSWTPANSGDQMSWQATGSCIDLATGQISGDTGSFSMPANTLQKQQGMGVADNCTVTIAVRRSRDGDLDHAYGKGGTIRGVQARTVTVMSTP
jgi:hypothetical protein